MRELTTLAKCALKQLYKAGIPYKKCGVMLTELLPKAHAQLDLFHQARNNEPFKSETMMALMESINSKYGARTIRLAAEGFQKTWAMQRQMKSPNYTTCWADLPVIKTR